MLKEAKDCVSDKHADQISCTKNMSPESKLK